MLEVGAEDVMAMLDLIDNGGELAGQPGCKGGRRRSRQSCGLSAATVRARSRVRTVVDGKSSV